MIATTLLRFLNNGDKSLIGNEYLFKNYRARKLIKEFPEKERNRLKTSLFSQAFPSFSTH